ARREPAIARGHDRAQLLDQGGLAHARLAADHHTAASPGPRVFKGRPQHIDLMVAPHEPRGLGQAQRDVTLPDPYPRRTVTYSLQVVDQSVRRLIAIVRLLLQQMHDDLGES